LTLTVRTLDFYFDFISPFGYLASLRVDALAAKYGRECRWHSMLLGISVLKVMGMKPLPSYPLKGPYLARDMKRYTRRHGIVLDRQDKPASPLPAGRCFHWLKGQNETRAQLFARAALHAYWREATDIGDPQVVAAIAASAADVDRGAVLAAIASDGAGDKLLRAAVDLSMQKGVFGSPTFIVDEDEPFFGLEKMELLEEWLSSGGW
jgi:2-hydroxychromene-2-carboxylate isomerase